MASSKALDLEQNPGPPAKPTLSGRECKVWARSSHVSACIGPGCKYHQVPANRSAQKERTTNRLGSYHLHLQKRERLLQPTYKGHLTLVEYCSVLRFEIACHSLRHAMAYEYVAQRGISHFEAHLGTTYLDYDQARNSQAVLAV